MKFTESHEWVEINGETATVGISDYAQKELGDIVFVELPLEGRHVKAGAEAVVIESTKAAVDIYSPVSGEITEINTSLREYPEKVNNSPEGEGWLFKVKFENKQELNALMDAPAYHDYISKKP